MSKLLWKPTTSQVNETNLASFFRFLNKRYSLHFNNDYQLLWEWSVNSRQDFWKILFEYLEIKCTKKDTAIISKENEIINQKFFENIEVNYAENILQSVNETPIIFFNEKGHKEVLTKEELKYKVGKLSNYFRSIGIQKNDRIAAIAANTPNTIISFLAANSIGAIWTSCSPDFGTSAILDRFSQIDPKVLLYSDTYFYGGKKIEVKKKIEEVSSKLKTLTKKILINYPGAFHETSKDYLDLESIYSNDQLDHKIIFEKNFFNDPMYILYSSGTTGKPKCIIHNTGGPLIQHMKEQQLHCDVKPNDKILYFTTCGWMMWNWLVSAMASKASIVLYDGSPFFPNKDSILEIVNKENIQILGISAKYIDALKNENIYIQDKYSLKNLKCILSTGSPLSSEGFSYIYDNIKKNIHLASISGGTDIVSCFVAGNPMLPVYAGEIQCKCLGVEVDIFNIKGNSTSDKGELVCRSSIPSMPVGFWNDHNKNKYKKTYFSQYHNIWSQGDYAQITENGGIIIYGRSDATLNPGGIRIGTAELYRVVEAIKNIEEVIAVAQNWNNDVRIILFVKLSHNINLTKDYKQLISQELRNQLSVRHVPAHIIQVADIPKTRSGKIAELTIKDIINGDPVKNIEALSNPDCLKEYQNIAEIKK